MRGVDLDCIFHTALRPELGKRRGAVIEIHASPLVLLERIEHDLELE